MTLRLSTNLRNRLLGDPVTASSCVTYTAVTNADIKAASTSTFTDVISGFLTKGFSVGDGIMAYGFDGDMLHVHGPFTITIATAGTLTVSGTPLSVDAASGVKATLVALKGGSLKDIFKDGVLEVYTGTQPATADAVKTGTLLLRITQNSATFAQGAAANGLEFATASAGAIGKHASEVWSAVAVATGTAGWFRFYANATDTGTADTTPFLYPRVDGAVATSGAELNMSSTVVTTGATTTVDTFTLTFPGA